MKLEICESEPEPKVRLRLVSKDGAIFLQAVDENGERSLAGDLLKITEQGVYLIGAVNPNFGFALGSDTKLSQLSSG